MIKRHPHEDLFESTKMTFGEHLEELRVALFKSVLGLVVGVVLGMFAARHVVMLLTVPLETAIRDYREGRAAALLKQEFTEIPSYTNELLDAGYRPLLVYEVPEGTWSEAHVAQAPGDALVRELKRKVYWTRPNAPEVKTLGMPEPFVIWMKASLLVGVLIASPWIFYQIWSFVAAGLYPHEKQYVYTFLPMSVGLFWAGAALALFFVTRYVLEFFLTFNHMMGVDPDPRFSEWLGFALILPLGFGVSFQLPLVMFALERVGIVSEETYLKQWRVAVLIIFVLSMMLTPGGDPFSMLFMALPLTFLYFGGVGLCRWMPRRRSPFGELAEPGERAAAPPAQGDRREATKV